MRQHRWRSLRAALLLVITTGAAGCSLRIQASAECREAIDTLNRHGQIGSEVLDRPELLETVDRAVGCIPTRERNETARDLANASFTLRGEEIPSENQACIEPIAGTDLGVFFVAHHDRTHDLAMSPEHIAVWAEAMANCVDLSFVINERIPGGISSDEAVCLDEAQLHPKTLLPYFSNLALSAERVAYSDWDIADLDVVFDPMYRCLDIAARAIPVEIAEELSPEAEACISDVVGRHHLMSREFVPPETYAASIDEMFQCGTPAEDVVLEMWLGTR